LILPGLLSNLKPREGIVKECITSSEVIKNLIGRLQGKYKGLSTNKYFKEELESR
jgi:hypothetical protein